MNAVLWPVAEPRLRFGFCLYFGLFVVFFIVGLFVVLVACGDIGRMWFVCGCYRLVVVVCCFDYVVDAVAASRLNLLLVWL